MRSFTLPYPPSVNHYWRHVGGKTLVSREGRRYRSTVRALLAGTTPLMRSLTSPRTSPLTGRLAVAVTLHPPDRRRRDLDNTLKALLDAVGHGGAYTDDSQIDDLRVTRGALVARGLARIDIREIGIDGTS